MDLRRLRTGEWITGLSGLVLLVALFLPWYGVEQAAAAAGGWTMYAPLGTVTMSGWEAFTLLDLILALLALAALSVPIVTAGHRVPALPLALQSLTALFGMVCLLLVLFRVLNLPGDAHGREWGLWLALAAVLGIVAGALIAMRDERRSPEGRHTDATGVPIPSPREIETMQAPRPEAGS